MNRELFEKAMNELDDKYIQEAAGYRKKASRGRIARIGSLAACAVVVLIGVVGLVSNGIRNDKSGSGAAMEYVSETKGYYENAAVEVEAPADWEAEPEAVAEEEWEAVKGQSADSRTPGNEGRPDIAAPGQPGNVDTSKIIYTARIQLESQAFTESYEKIEKIVSQTGGYFEENAVYDKGEAARSANMTIRLPKDQFDTAVEQLKQVCHVTFANQEAQNVSETYYDIQSRLETAKIKLDRLQALLAEATEMSDIIELENAISDAQWEVDSLSGNLKYYDSLIGYSTIYVDLSEVQILTDTTPEPVSFGARLKNAFVDGLHAIGDGIVNFVLWFVSNIIWIGIIAAAVIIAVVVIKKKKRGI